jgi:hypothetical protein
VVKITRTVVDGRTVWDFTPDTPLLNRHTGQTVRQVRYDFPYDGTPAQTDRQVIENFAATYGAEHLPEDLWPPRASD